MPLQRRAESGWFPANRSPDKRGEGVGESCRHISFGKFEVGDLGYIPKGSVTTIVVPERALLLHVTQPAWQEEK